MPEAWKASMAAASVALGLLPTLLAAIGPSISETSLLSSQRPMLAFLLSLGAPAAQPSRLLEYEDPFDLLDARGGRLVVPPLSPLSAMAVSGLEYVAAAAAVANALHTSFQLGINTVSAASCTIWELPMIWSLLSVVVHLVAAVGFWNRVRDNTRGSQDSSTGTPIQNTSSPIVPAEQHHGAAEVEITLMPLTLQRRSGSSQVKSENSLNALWHSILQQMEREFLPCSNRTPSTISIKPSKMPRLAVLLAVLASFAAYVQLICGTVFLASLLFVSVKDAVVNIVLRFVLSAILCRLVLLVELGGMRRPVQ
ncbi:uncharacterized protein KY384_008895 [Bacidia gigantensis]|uniref:uncharacterized protein n=1 Tax=Bacidia gigantensis TaxID=2732470 RepID=UPI001D03A3D2|nr:uncharacterized protein KY384_008895 [Bacidia gigantensis]KAG8525251.1 hypothetical protein KY384_008895 [Bacidia gigantensis]